MDFEANHISYRLDINGSMDQFMGYSAGIQVFLIIPEWRDRADFYPTNSMKRTTLGKHDLLPSNVAQRSRFLQISPFNQDDQLFRCHQWRLCRSQLRASQERQHVSSTSSQAFDMFWSSPKSDSSPSLPSSNYSFSSCCPCCHLFSLVFFLYHCI